MYIIHNHGLKIMVLFWGPKAPEYRYKIKIPGVFDPRNLNAKFQKYIAVKEKINKILTKPFIRASDVFIILNYPISTEFFLPL